MEMWLLATLSRVGWLDNERFIFLAADLWMMNVSPSQAIKGRHKPRRNMKQELMGTEV
jgi:hypothetical protein